MQGQAIGRESGPRPMPPLNVAAQGIRQLTLVARETLVGLSHRKADPWRVNPFRASCQCLTPAV